MNLERPLGYLLGRSFRVFKMQLVDEFKQHGIELTFEQFVMLHLLLNDGSLIQRDLATHMQKDKSIIVRQFNYLLENDYVVSHVHQVDRRKKSLILTEKGLNILTQMKELATEVSDKLLNGVTDEELLIFQGVLMKIQANGGEIEECCGNN